MLFLRRTNKDSPDLDELQLLGMSVIFRMTGCAKQGLSCSLMQRCIAKMHGCPETTPMTAPMPYNTALECAALGMCYVAPTG